MNTYVSTLEKVELVFNSFIKRNSTTSRTVINSNTPGNVLTSHLDLQFCVYKCPDVCCHKHSNKMSRLLVKINSFLPWNVLKCPQKYAVLLHKQSWKNSWRCPTVLLKISSLSDCKLEIKGYLSINIFLKVSSLTSWLQEGHLQLFTEAATSCYVNTESLTTTLFNLF